MWQLQQVHIERHLVQCTGLLLHSMYIHVAHPLQAGWKYVVAYSMLAAGAIQT
jgi:hypothetical protein